MAAHDVAPGAAAWCGRAWREDGMGEWTADHVRRTAPRTTL